MSGLLGGVLQGGSLGHEVLQCAARCGWDGQDLGCWAGCTDESQLPEQDGTCWHMGLGGTRGPHGRWSLFITYTADSMITLAELSDDQCSVLTLMDNITSTADSMITLAELSDDQCSVLTLIDNILGKEFCWTNENWLRGFSMYKFFCSGRLNCVSMFAYREGDS